MDVDFARLAKEVRDELDAYVVPAHDPGAIGEPLPTQWFEDGLNAMRASLIQPHWIKIRDLDPNSGGLVIVQVALVAADQDGTLVAFDPAQGEFVLALRDPDPEAGRAIDAVSCGVRGDAVGCFLSR